MIMTSMKTYFLAEFANDLSKPITEIEAPIEYLPTQLMSEYLRKEGFDGIYYKSSLTPQIENYPYYKGNDIPNLRNGSI